MPIRFGDEIKTEVDRLKKLTGKAAQGLSLPVMVFGFVNNIHEPGYRLKLNAGLIH